MAELKTSLLAGIEEDCPPQGSFEEQVRRALALAVEFFATHPERLSTLSGQRRLGSEELGERIARRRRCAELLRGAAERSPGTVVPPIPLESILIDGVAWQISSKLAAGTGSEELKEMLAEFLLAYYLPVGPAPLPAEGPRARRDEA